MRVHWIDATVQSARFTGLIPYVRTPASVAIALPEIAASAKDHEASAGSPNCLCTIRRKTAWIRKLAANRSAHPRVLKRNSPGSDDLGRAAAMTSTYRHPQPAI